MCFQHKCVIRSWCNRFDTGARICRLEVCSYVVLQTWACIQRARDPKSPADLLHIHLHLCCHNRLAGRNRGRGRTGHTLNCAGKAPSSNEENRFTNNRKKRAISFAPQHCFQQWGGIIVAHSLVQCACLLRNLNTTQSLVYIRGGTVIIVMAWEIIVHYCILAASPVPCFATGILLSSSPSCAHTHTYI